MADLWLFGETFTSIQFCGISIVFACFIFMVGAESCSTPKEKLQIDVDYDDQEMLMQKALKESSKIHEESDNF